MFNNSFSHLSLREKGEVLTDWYMAGAQDGMLMRFRELSDLFTYRYGLSKLA